MNPSDLAIVTPCHSYPLLLPEAIQSVQGQTVNPFIHICVLDHVGGEYTEVVRRHEGCWTRFYASDSPRGVSGARNQGFMHAIDYGCTHVCLLDEDDKLHPDYVRRMAQASRLLPEADVLYCDWVRFGSPSWTGYVRCPEYSFNELQAHPFIISTSVISIDIWQRVKERNGEGFDTQLTELGLRWEDYLFFLEAAACGAHIARVGMGLVRVRGSGEGSEIANHTRKQWYEYANAKLKRLYNFELVPV